MTSQRYADILKLVMFVMGMFLSPTNAREVHISFIDSGRAVLQNDTDLWLVDIATGQSHAIGVVTSFAVNEKVRLLLVGAREENGSQLSLYRLEADGLKLIEKSAIDDLVFGVTVANDRPDDFCILANRKGDPKKKTHVSFVRVEEGNDIAVGKRMTTHPMPLMNEITTLVPSNYIRFSSDMPGWCAAAIFVDARALLSHPELRLPYHPGYLMAFVVLDHDKIVHAWPSVPVFAQDAPQDGKPTEMQLDLPLAFEHGRIFLRKIGQDRDGDFTFIDAKSGEFQRPKFPDGKVIALDSSLDTAVIMQLGKLEPRAPARDFNISLADTGGQKIDVAPFTWLDSVHAAIAGDRAIVSDGKAIWIVDRKEGRVERRAIEVR